MERGSGHFGPEESPVSVRRASALRGTAWWGLFLYAEPHRPRHDRNGNGGCPISVYSHFMRIWWCMALKERGLTIPEIILIGGTRAALGVGVGLLVADRLNKDQRQAAGWALFAFGVLSTVPLVMNVLAKPSHRRAALGS
jgi:hypothetical protein